jgi:hypothetical protein
MSTNPSCPVCGSHVEGTGNATRIGLGAGSVANERSRCDSCGIALIRNPDSQACPWSVDRDDRSVQQSRARLEALANDREWDFEDAYESSPGIWRCHLYEKEFPPTGGRSSPVWGAGISAEDALQEAVYEAEVKRLL